DPIIAEAVAVVFAAYTLLALVVPAFRPGVLIVAAAWLVWRAINLALAVRDRLRRRTAAPTLAGVDISEGPVIDAPPLTAIGAAVNGAALPTALPFMLGYGGVPYGGGVYGG